MTAELEWVGRTCPVCKNTYPAEPGTPFPTHFVKLRPDAVNYEPCPGSGRAEYVVEQSLF